MSNSGDETTSAGPAVGEAGVLAALDDAEMGIFVLDSNFRVEWLNSTAATYFGLEQAAAIGRDKRTLIESSIKEIFEQPDRFAETVIDTYDDNTYIEEFECHVLSSEARAERWLRHQSRPIETGVFAGGRIEHYTDITAQKQREADLTRERDRLDEFAGVVSHDLRNPLNVAQGRLEIARDDCDSPELDHVAGALARMERIIGDVLWLARAGRDIGDTEPVDLAATVEDAWTLVVDGATDAELVVAPELVGRTIDADGDRLSQLLENLLSNAITHGGDGVTVRVDATETGFAISDDGPGIPPENREKVFDPGYSLSADGTGFGLGIVRQIIDAHGWTISVEAADSGGARFEISGVSGSDD